MRELDLQKAKTVDKSKQKDDAKNAKPKSILESEVYQHILLAYLLQR